MKKWMKKAGIYAVMFVFVLAGALCLKSNTLKAEAKTVATIGKKKYSSLDKAIKKVKNNQTIKLKANINITKALKINKKGKKFTIDMNKKKVYCYKEITVKAGTVTLKNARMNSAMSMGEMITIGKGATVKVVSGTYNGTFNNKGTLNIQNGTFTAMNETVLNYGKATIKKGTFKSHLAAEAGTLTINGGKYTTKYGISVLDNRAGNLIVNGGTFTGPETNPIYVVHVQKGSTTVNGGTFKITKGSVFCLYDEEANLLINNGTFTVAEQGDVLESYVVNYNKGAAIINGGIFTATDATVIGGLPINASLTINGGTFTADDTYYAVDFDGIGDCSVVITGGEFNGRVRITNVYSKTITGGTFNKEAIY